MDVRTATCLKPEDTKRILGELLKQAWASSSATRWSSACCARRFCVRLPRVALGYRVRQSVEHT